VKVENGEKKRKCPPEREMNNYSLGNKRERGRGKKAPFDDGKHTSKRTCVCTRPMR
jgi:hypothetical protein